MLKYTLSRLEHVLGLFPAPQLTPFQQIVRLIFACFFKPQSLQHDKNHPDFTPDPTVLFTVLSVIKRALSDLINPLMILIKLTLSPFKWAKKKFNQRLDSLFLTYQPSLFLLKIAESIQNNQTVFALLCVTFLLIFIFVAQSNLPLYGQWVFVTLCYVAAQFFIRLPKNMANLCLMALTLLLLARYVFWRLSGSLDLLPGMEATLGYVLLAAEAYTWIIVVLGFIQVAWPLKRTPIPLQTSPQQWPTVDVFIPSYNEPLHIVKTTVYAAQSMDWPIDKLTIYLLDDGNRADFKAFAEQIGIEYIARNYNTHAKAGNINHALQHSKGEFIAIFHCDHIPCRSFLQTTLGTLLNNPNCALVQTPHHFFSADPFEKNYDVFRQVPNEGELFYGLIQDGNDYWNATFFCGSCAVIRRKPLEEIGGVAVETVTEDAHTSLKLHSKGYDSAYLNIPQAAGLATDTLADHISQRIRWARGMAQIFRIDNPFLKKGLTLFQKVCYANAMMHFFYGIPRLIFLLMPGAFLFFEYYVINASATAILSHAIPPLIFASFTNSFIQGKFRKSFWSEIYETVLSWYIILPTTLAMINPKLGKFNVTPKEKRTGDSYFDFTIAHPYLIIIAINLLAFVIGLSRLFMWNSHEIDTVLMNLLWCSINLILLGAAVGVATEQKQEHAEHRVKMIIPATLLLPNGHTLSCYTSHYSSQGFELVLGDTSHITDNMNAYVGLHRASREFLFPVKLSAPQNGHTLATLQNLSSEQEAKLVQCTFGRADAWLNWQENQFKDQPLSGLYDVILKGGLGYKRLALHLQLTSLKYLNNLYISRKKPSKYTF